MQESWAQRDGITRREMVNQPSTACLLIASQYRIDLTIHVVLEVAYFIIYFSVHISLADTMKYFCRNIRSNEHHLPGDEGIYNLVIIRSNNAEGWFLC